MTKKQAASRHTGTLEATLAQAVRNSLNLPGLRVDVRHIPTRRAWRLRLHKDSVSSGWIELDDGAAAIMKKLGLLPALHLGTFRVAYQELRVLTEVREPTMKAQRHKGKITRRRKAP
jgi:hypothetical protein